MIGALIELARPRHWIKSAFIVLPVPFSLAAGAQLDLAVFLAGLAGFCLVASSVYVFNDIQDAEADRLSPAKRGRPVAAGAVSVPQAYAFAAGLAASGLGLVAATGIPAVWILVGLYAAANVAYSTGAKHVPLLDVFLLASGFVIRVLVGAALVRAAPSSWLLLCASALALFLAFAKRRADLVAGVDPGHRPALAGYSVAFLDQAMGICAAIALLTYALYSQDSPVFVEGRALLGLPFVAFAILDYLRLAYTRNAGGSPVEMVFRSRELLLCVVGWTVATAWSLGAF